MSTTEGVTSVHLPTLPRLGMTRPSTPVLSSGASQKSNALPFSDIPLVTMSGATAGHPLGHTGEALIRARTASESRSVRPRSSFNRTQDVAEPSSEMREAQEDPRLSAVISREAGERDPLLLRDRIINDDTIEGLRNRSTDKRRGKKVSKFYEEQNSHIERLLKPLDMHVADAAEEEAQMAGKIKWAIRLSFGANFVLAALQLYAAISSVSLSLFATAIDAVFDPFANLLLNILHKKSTKVDEKKWPMGGSRFESIGNIVYGGLMGMVNLILIVESIQSIATHDGSDTTKLHIPSLVAVGVAFVTKLALFLYCFALRKSSSQVEVLYEDHRNDLFVNGFGIFTSAAGAKIVWFLDPMGALIIASCIIVVWTRTVYGQFKLLAGIAAPVEFQQLVVYKAMTFSEHIKAIDTCRVYHSGPQFFVEVDIVMNGEMPLHQAHDIAQDLQDQIEALPDVDRCFVHIDHEVEHKPEHRKYA